MNSIHNYQKTGRWLILVLSIFLRNYESAAQGIFPKAKFVVKFHTTKEGLILVDASFGQHEQGVFLLDSGAGMTVVDQKTTKTYGLGSDHTSPLNVQGPGPAVGGSQSWAHIKIKQKYVVLAEGDFPSLDLGLVQEGVGFPISGIIGSAALSKYVVSIDYLKGELSFFEPPKWHYNGNGQIFRMRDSGNTHMFVLDGSVVLTNCVTVPLRLSIDSGSNHDLVFNHFFLESHPSVPVSSGPHDEKSASVGGGLDGKWIDLSSLALGSYTLSVADSFALKADSQTVLDQYADASIGTEVLQQFKVIVDVPGSQIILEPRSDLPLKVAEPCKKAAEANVSTALPHPKQLR